MGGANDDGRACQAGGGTEASGGLSSAVHRTDTPAAPAGASTPPATRPCQSPPSPLSGPAPPWDNTEFCQARGEIVHGMSHGKAWPLPRSNRRVAHRVCQPAGSLEI